MALNYRTSSRIGCTDMSESPLYNFTHESFREAILNAIAETYEEGGLGLMVLTSESLMSNQLENTQGQCESYRPIKCLGTYLVLINATSGSSKIS